MLKISCTDGPGIYVSEYVRQGGKGSHKEMIPNIKKKSKMETDKKSEVSYLLNIKTYLHVIH